MLAKIGRVIVWTLAAFGGGTILLFTILIALGVGQDKPAGDNPSNAEAVESAPAEQPAEPTEKELQQLAAERDLWVTLLCRDAVEDLLISPATAQHPRNQTNLTHPGGMMTLLESYVDSQNAWGAVVRTRYRCLIEFVGPSYDLDHVGSRKSWSVPEIQVIEPS